MENNLKKLRKLNKFTQEQIAKKLNITQQTYANYESAKTEAPHEVLKKLSNIYNTSVDFLLGNNIKKNNNKGVKIAVLGTIPAGIPIEAIEDIIDYEEITEEMARTGTYFALKVKGDSMSPTIANGDVVIVRQQDDAENGKICVVMINGFDATLKEIKKDLNGIWILPHNPNCEFKPTFYSNKEIMELPIRILGVAVEIRRTI
mgnify:CR=1 FL=1